MPKQTEITSFVHPTAGPVTVDGTLLAIRWRPEARDDAKAALIGALGLVEAAPEGAQSVAAPSGAGGRPLLRVNRTSGLWWVRRNDEKALAPASVQRLEEGELVDWIAPAIRPSGSEADPNAVFTINPTRLLLSRRAIDEQGGLAQSHGLVPEPDRGTRIPGFVAVRVEPTGTVRGLARFAAALEAASSFVASPSLGASAVRFENIPFLSPTCQACHSPAGEYTPNDPLFAKQWGLSRIGVRRAWGIARGSRSVVVAVIDEGVELGHPDLDVSPTSWNASTDTPDGSPTGSHGTACAGIIGARIDNGLGLAGVAAGVRVMGIATATWADVDVAEALYFAADAGADVVSMSFGAYPWWNAWDFDLIRDALQHATDRGLVLVAASGNENIPESRFPGSDSRTICVGGSNRSDERKRIGDTSAEAFWGASYGPAVDVVAPCLEIPTTDRLAADGYDPGDYFESFNGTSAATPHVAGLAALVRSLRPSLGADTVRQVIESTCDKIAPHLYTYANVGPKPHGSWNEEVGYGRINAERALLAACAIEGSSDGDCTGCGGRCVGETPAECRGPAPVPWLEHDRCMYFYEGRTFTSRRQERERVVLRIIYEHCLRLVGRQQGPLLYTTTLLPGETVDLYQEDRYRRVRSQSERVSVQSSFRQTMAALSESRRSGTSASYTTALASFRTQSDASVSAGGGLAGFFGAPSVSGEISVGTQATVASASSTRLAADDFVSISRTAAQATEAERSVLISSFEDDENRDVTVRHLKNVNHCYAVTYYVRRVNEAYEARTRVAATEWSIAGGPWRATDDLAGVAPNVQRLVRDLAREAPRVGETIGETRQVTLPTDGVAFEPELAHCSSCEPAREAEILVELEVARLRARRECLESDLLALELERRRALTGTGAVPLILPEWEWTSRERASAEPAGLAGPGGSNDEWVGGRGTP